MSKYANAYQEKINAQLTPEATAPRKQIMLHLTEDTIARLTRMATEITKISGTRVTRNTMIEDAIYIFLDESEPILEKLRQGKGETADE